MRYAFLMLLPAFMPAGRHLQDGAAHDLDRLQGTWLLIGAERANPQVPDKMVGTTATVESVVAITPVNNVAVITAANGVIATISIQSIVSLPASDYITSFAPLDSIITIATMIGTTSKRRARNKKVFIARPAASLRAWKTSLRAWR